MLELKISNGDMLSKVLKPFIEIVEEGVAIYTPDGILLVALDLEEFVHVALITQSFDLDNDFFRCNHRGVSVVNFVVLRELLELEHDEDSINIFAAAWEDRFHILINQQYDCNVSLGIPSEDFHQIFLDWVLAGVPVSVTVTYEQVEFSVGEQRSVLPKGDGEQGECMIEGVEEGGRFELETTLVTINKFTDASRLSNRVWTYLSEGAPPMLKFPVADIGNIMFYFNE